MEIKSKKQTLYPTTFLSTLEYGHIRKLATPYQFSTRRPDEAMRPMTYAVADKEEKIATFFINAEGREDETTNTAKPGDIIISGTSGELYINTAAKFAKNYTGEIGGPIVAEQTPRKVARVPQGTPDFSFTATWGEPMPSRAGDLIVEETGENGKISHYRVREAEALKTYEVDKLPKGKEAISESDIVCLQKKSAVTAQTKTGRAEKAKTD